MKPKNSDARKNTPEVRFDAAMKTSEEIKNQGEEAARLLDSPVYNLAHRSVIQNLQDEWMATNPHEREKREGLYHRIQALSTVSEELAVMVSLAKQLDDDALLKESKVQLAYDENTGFSL